MKLIVLSPPNSVPNEHEIITSLFENGLEIFQVHKPELSEAEIQKYIEKIPSKYHKKIVRHADFPKFNSIKELESYKGKYEYAFLSPIFDSISKPEYKAQFSSRSKTSLPGKKGFSQINPKLSDSVIGKKIVALGGVDFEKIELVRMIGFIGVAVLGAIWNSKDPLKEFDKMKALCQRKEPAH